MGHQHDLLLRASLQPSAGLSGTISDSLGRRRIFTLLSRENRSVSITPVFCSAAETHLHVPAVVNQAQINRQLLVLHFLGQDGDITSSVTRHIAGLLRLG